MRKRDPNQPIVNSIDVPDMDAAIRRVEGAGGLIVVPKMPIPTVGWLAYFKDRMETSTGFIRTIRRRNEQCPLHRLFSIDRLNVSSSSLTMQYAVRDRSITRYTFPHSGCASPPAGRVTGILDTCQRRSGDLESVRCLSVTSYTANVPIGWNAHASYSPIRKSGGFDLSTGSLNWRRVGEGHVAIVG